MNLSCALIKANIILVDIIIANDKKNVDRYIKIIFIFLYFFYTVFKLIKSEFTKYEMQ